MNLSNCSRIGSVSPFSNDELEIEFSRFDDDDNAEQQSDRPKRQPSLSQVFPEKEDIEDDFTRGFFENSQQTQAFTNNYFKNDNTEQPRPQQPFKNTAFGNNNREESEEEEDGDFEVEVRPVRQQEQKKGGGGLRHRGGPQTFRTPVQVPPKIFRPKLKQGPLFRQKPRLFGINSRPFNNGPSAPRHRSASGPARHAHDFTGSRDVPIDRNDDLEAPPVIRRPPPQEAQGVRTTTPRPIPTPGPEDFPPPPPPRPTVPTVPPTHPPPITHPPSHYLPAAYLPGNKLDSSNYEDDYDVHEKEDNEEEEGESGFFEVPSGFPSLASLGSGFESMRIRNKRSATDLDGGEQRYRRRQFAASPYAQGRHRRQHSGGGGGNNDYSFQQNFWDDVDIDTRDFFPPQSTPQQQQGD